MRTTFYDRDMAEMANKSKQQFLTKTTSFGGKKITMFSLDGQIWSTRKEELNVIKERLENQKITLELAGNKGNNASEEAPAEEEKEKEEDLSDDLDDLPIGDIELDEADKDEEAHITAATKKKGGKVEAKRSAKPNSASSKKGSKPSKKKPAKAAKRKAA